MDTVSDLTFYNLPHLDARWARSLRDRLAALVAAVRLKMVSLQPPAKMTVLVLETVQALMLPQVQGDDLPSGSSIRSIQPP
jgi:hypothetical protein